ncbi:MAG TPA: response regulator [Bryobacteraceae bacterium]|jgi:MinD-like ATPase involved in chromosome partitioning or flagellar assembly/CheY-like chemotaxis protein|nr:response regulator [Bryobacteraceae bacterium]
MPQEPELSVLLIEDEPDAARLIQHVLAKGGPNPVIVEWAGDLRTGLERLAERDFQAVLLDLNLPDSAGFDTFACVRHKVPNRAVIVLTGQEDDEMALQAVRAGADEYLVKSEIRDRFLLQRIRYAVERNRLKGQDSGRALKNGKVISFLGAKGGAGTTTLVVNLAAALASAGKNVIAIELMPEFGAFATLLNYSPSRDIATLLRGAPETITRDTMACCLEEVEAGFRVLCGPQRAEDYRPVSADQARLLFGIARKLADYTLVDVPSIFAPSIAEVVGLSALTTVVVERNRMGLNAAVAKMPTLQAMTPHPGSLGAVLINKVPFIEYLTPSECGKRLSCGILGVIPPAADLQAAGETEAPPVLSRPDSPFSLAIQEVSRRLTVGSGRILAA